MREGDGNSRGQIGFLEAPEDGAPGPDFALGAAVMSGVAPKVFIADDDPVLLLGLERALSARGYEVWTAADGPALLSLLEVEPPDVLVLDIMMPGMSGLDVLRRVREDRRWAGLPVVIITALADPLVLAAVREWGATDLVQKPFRLSELLARIEDRLGAAPGGQGDGGAGG